MTEIDELKAEIERLKRELGRVDPQGHRCMKQRQWLCGMGYGHSGPCGAVNYPNRGD